ncbi:8808_t:CDS:2 [Ambispora gerdemannii]|uniref:8808_t:CDS:1 n=1 Tax=Ambispora gerdemannii TaxID=144530 RepID=A0A9N9GKK8_9GLOM|nr:8808_t:CDS:2 [Ambispora gerdemannii]
MCLREVIAKNLLKYWLNNHELAGDKSTTLSVNIITLQSLVGRKNSTVIRGRISTSQGSAMEPSPNKELNILLLGETGVGKSTFINALVNYLKFDTLDDAQSGDLEVLISSKFTTMDEEYEMRTVKIGNDDSNEQLERPGMSATQGCKSYRFLLGDMLVRLIDTPGIGDTRGIDQDKENFENILKYISNFENLHGICILLKPNNSRLTVIFRFCIQELLSHLHKNAKDNIVFCFTNSRGTLYRPGDTLPALKEQLRALRQRSGVEIKTNQNTMYCFDSESFRFLAAVKAGIKFEEMDEQSFAESWKRSVGESVRLLGYLCLRDPHKVKDTLTLNDARRIVINLAKPLAEAERLIKTNIALIDERQKEIDSCNESIQDLNRRLFIPQKDLHSVQLGYPRTVCTACRKEVVNGKINYNAQCHPHCYLSGVACNVINNSALQSCAAMGSNGSCNNCGCSWATHMHVTWEATFVTKNVVDESVKAQINDKKTFQDTKANAIKLCQRRRQQLEQEQKKITEINITFAKFLRQSAIATFNDAYAEYLDHFIKEEKMKKSVDPANYDDGVLQGLEKTKKEYLAKIEVIKKAIACNDPSESPVSPDEIAKLEKELYNLKLNGETLKNMKDVAMRSQTAAFKHEEKNIRLSGNGTQRSRSRFFSRFFQ